MRRKRRTQLDTIPEVPDDSALRQHAIEISTTELLQLDQLTAQVEHTTKNLRHELKENHFINRIRFSYGHGR